MATAIVINKPLVKKDFVAVAGGGGGGGVVLPAVVPLTTLSIVCKKFIV